MITLKYILYSYVAHCRHEIELLMYTEIAISYDMENQ